jgi:hypothetical protein
MIYDKLTTFATDMDCSQAAGTFNFTDVIDSSVVRDLGNGQPVYLVCVCTGGDSGIITGGNAGTIAFQLVSDSTSTIATDGTQSVHMRSKLYVTDDAALNEINLGDIFWVIPLPTNGVEAYERYVGLQMVVATTTTTEGTVTAFLSLDPTGWKAYPDNAH